MKQLGIQPKGCTKKIEREKEQPLNKDDYTVVPHGTSFNPEEIKDMVKKRSTVTIKNNDNLCLPRAILVGYTHLMSKIKRCATSAKVYHRMRDSRCIFQREEAIKLVSIVGIPIHRTGSIEDIHLYEDYLQISITVVSAMIDDRKIYSGSDKYAHRIFLYHSGKPPYTRFDTIVNMKGLLHKSKYCNTCDKRLKNQKDHKCRQISYSTYMKNISSDLKTDKFIFFNCQTDNETHNPNFVTVHSICTECEDYPVTNVATCKNCGSRCILCNKFNAKEKTWERDHCITCGKRQVIFRGSDAKKVFCKWLINIQHKDVTVIAHNVQGYGCNFIYEYLITKLHNPEHVLMQGSKITHLKVPTNGINIRLLDSQNFLPMPLAQLPSSFGIKEMKKGFFPHSYNTVEHQNNVLLRLPDKKFYDLENMSVETKKEFLKWYEEHEYDVFNFQKEMEEYCISDVDILLKTCWKFKHWFKFQAGRRTELKNLELLMVEAIQKNSVDYFSFLALFKVCMGIFKG